MNVIRVRRFTTMIPSGSKLLTADGIEFDKKLWLVPKWLASPDGSLLTPELMIRFDTLPHEQGVYGHDYLLNEPIPKAVLDGETTVGYEVRQGDQVGFLIQKEQAH